MKKIVQKVQKVRFQDCDPFNHLNNSSYIDYFMNAREDQILENYQLDIYEHLRTTGQAWVVASNQISYIKPVMMNEKAEEIGMTSTNFSNASGLNDPDNYSTVRDIAMMSKYLIKNYPIYYEYFKETEFTWDRTGGTPITQQNRNILLFKNIGVDGIKTGHLVVEEYSLASSIMKNSRRLIAVGSGFKSISARSNQSRKLLTWGLTSSETFEIAKKEEAKFEINTWLGRKKTTPGYTKENVYFTLDKKDIRNFNVFIEYPGPLKAPVNKDDEIAYIKIYNKDELIKSVPIYAAEKVKKLNFLLSLFMSFNYMIWGDA